MKTARKIKNNNAPPIQLSLSAQKLSGSPMFQFLAKAQELEQQGKKIYHFEIGDPDFDTPRHINSAAIKAIKNGETHYVNSMGMRELREAIRLETKRINGFKPDIEQIVVAPAISFIYFVTRCVVNPGEEVIVPDPGFASYYSAFDFIGVKFVGIPLLEKNNFRMSPDDIRRSITPKTRLIIVNSPHNPTGAVMTQKEMLEIAKIASKNKIYLLTDEAYSRMTYGKKHQSPASFDKCKKNIIILNSFSKTYAMTGWRLGWAVAPSHIAKKMGLMIETLISAVPPFIQKAGIAALAGSQEFVKKSVAEYNRRRDIMVGLLNEMPGIRCLKPDGAFYVFPNITGTGMTSEKFAEFALEKAGVVLLPGTNFGKHGKGYVRLVYASSRQNIIEGMGKLKKALTKRT